MGYDLRHYSTTYQHTSKGNFDSDAMLNRYPFLCSREALYQALDGANLANNSQRNPNGYTVKQLTDKIIAHWDKVMFDHWGRSLTTDDVEVKYNNPRAFGAVIDNYKWDQPQFWSNDETSFIAFDTNVTQSRTAAQVIADTDIIILPSKQYDVNTTIYKQKPFLAFDDRTYYHFGGSTIAALIGTDDFGVELDVDGNKRVTGVTSSGTTDDPNSLPSSSNYLATLLHVYDFNFYHDDLNVNGSDFTVNGAYSGHDVLATSTKWFDLRRAKFSVTTSGGVVTAITPTAVNDGAGASRTGGWDYDSVLEDYYELYFILKQPLTNAMITPRVLFRTNTASDVTGEGQKATVDITDKESEFFEGLGITSAYIDTAFAVPTDSLGVTKGHSHSMSAQSEDTKDWTQRNWPSKAFGDNGQDPAVVRIVSERPALTTTSKGLRTTTVGTGAHRFRFEFEYPPMEYSEAQHFIEKFESFKGNTLPFQLYIPSTAIEHFQKWSTDNATSIADWSQRMNILSGTKGSDTMILGGHTPGTPRIADGTYFFTAQSKKIYQIVGAGVENPDIYGRVSYLIEPSFIADQTDDFIVSNHKTNNTHSKNYFLVKVFLEDSFLDYTVDAAGIYRMNFKFRECIDE